MTTFIVLSSSQCLLVHWVLFKLGIHFSFQFEMEIYPMWATSTLCLQALIYIVSPCMDGSHASELSRYLNSFLITGHAMYIKRCKFRISGSGDQNYNCSALLPNIPICWRIPVKIVKQGRDWNNWHKWLMFCNHRLLPIHYHHSWTWGQWLYICSIHQDITTGKLKSHVVGNCSFWKIPINPISSSGY